MIRDFLDPRLSANVEIQSDVCIVGGGTAGLFLAQDLCKRGLKVVVLEAGSERSVRPPEFGYSCEQIGVPFRGADNGRCFGIGGTSALWGGQMIPLSRSDFEERPFVDCVAWPISYSEVDPYLRRVNQFLGFNGYDDVPVHSSGARALGAMSADGQFDLRYSKWIPFKRRNFSRAFSSDIKGGAGLEVWLNAPVCSFGIDSSGDLHRVTSVSSFLPGGRALAVRAKYFVLAAGALETTRLLLEFNEVASGYLEKQGSPLGRYFADHLSVSVGHFRASSHTTYNRLVAPIFGKNGVMQTPRLEVSADSQRKFSLTSSFAHFTFRTTGVSGFDVVRSILRKRQGEAIQANLSASSLARASIDVSSMAYWRFMRQQLWIPPGSDLLLQVDIEQVPRWDSRLSLTDARDKNGRKRLAIDWKVGDEDVRIVNTVATLFHHQWGRCGFSRAADLEVSPARLSGSFDSIYDVYHPTGSVRMGTSVRNSVVDKDLRVWGTENLFASTTAVFPSAGSANPGMTHLALTMRLADCIDQSLKA